MTIENTSKRSPIAHMVGILSEGQNDYIVGMEAKGQRELVASSSLPNELQRPDTDADFEALGFTFGAETDELFREATLPDGWSKQGSDHDMWSYIVDADGVRRVAIFYKAAFYDRRAFMRLVRDAGF